MKRDIIFLAVGVVCGLVTGWKIGEARWKAEAELWQRVNEESQMWRDRALIQLAELMKEKRQWTKK